MARPAKSPQPDRIQGSPADEGTGAPVGAPRRMVGRSPSNGDRAHPAPSVNGRGHAPPTTVSDRTASQLDLFETSLRRSQKLALLLRLLGPLSGRRCFLLDRGSTLGAWNFRLRSAGGVWSWGSTSLAPIAEMEALLGEPVHEVGPGGVPFESEAFDVVVVLETHQLGLEPARIAGEVSRILAPGGRAVVAATRERASGGISGLEAMLEGVGLIPETRGACCRLFTELLDRFEELPRGPRRLMASVDHLMPASTGHEIAVSALKPGSG